MGLLSRKPGEPTLFPFKLCAFPLDISAKQKCLNLGGVQSLKKLYNINLMYMIVVLFLGEVKYGEGVKDVY